MKPYQAAAHLGYGVAACYAWSHGGSLPLSKVPLLAPRFGVTEERLRRVVRADQKARRSLVA
jgi:hypothetical protein